MEKVEHQSQESVGVLEYTHKDTHMKIHTDTHLSISLGKIPAGLRHPGKESFPETSRKKSKHCEALIISPKILIIRDIKQ